MRKTEHNLRLLTVLFVVSLVIANVVASKLFRTGLTLFGTDITLPGAVLCYAATFLATDVIGEIWGRQEADRTVKYGLFGQIISVIWIILTQYIPAADSSIQQAYEKLLGQNIIFVIGSIAAYLVSQKWDVYIFHKIREHFGGVRKKRWLWNNLSTITSQMIDTVLFSCISFGFGFGWFWDSNKRRMLLAMMLGQYCYKFLLAVLDTPFFYLLTRKSRVTQGK